MNCLYDPCQKCNHERQDDSNAIQSSLRQSPIDISSSTATIVRAEPLLWTSAYNEVLTSAYLISEDTSVKLYVQTKHPLYIGGGTLAASYKFDHLHFHWGMDDEKGSEHKIDGMAYPMEMHVVHLLTEDLPEIDDHIVIAYFFEIDNKTTEGLENILNVIESAAINKGSKQIVQPFVLADLVSNSPFDYYTYKGSRTTYPYDEGFTFIISNTVLSITSSDMNIFRNAAIINKNLRNNFRECQNLKDRTIYFVGCTCS